MCQIPRHTVGQSGFGEDMAIHPAPHFLGYRTPFTCIRGSSCLFRQMRKADILPYVTMHD